MASFPVIKNGFFLTAMAAAMLAAVSCNKLGDDVDAAQTKIESHLRGQNIYDRANLPTDPAPPIISGYYDVIGGAYRYIKNEEREGREDAVEIKRGDRISIYFDARIFSSSYDNSTTFYTNIASRIAVISNNNPKFDASSWPSDPLVLNTGEGSLLKAIDKALPSCRVGDEVRIFLPPDVGFGNKQVYYVPAKSTLAYEITILDVLFEDDLMTAYLNSLDVYARYFAPEDAKGYYDYIDGGVRHILNEGRPGRENRLEATAKDAICYNFDARIFNGSFENSKPFSSNIREIIDRIADENPGLDTSMWTTDPLEVALESNKIVTNGVATDETILKSLAGSLTSCRVGDKVWIFLPAEAAYGNTQEGIIPPGSTLLYEITVINVKK